MLAWDVWSRRHCSNSFLLVIYWYKFRQSVHIFKEINMLKFLSTVRRILLAGTISLILIFVFSLLRVSVPTINAPVAFSTAYTSFAFVSPVLGLIFWLISTIYIRKKGQSSAYQQTQPFFSTMIKMLISDITSPFRLIGEQFASIFNAVV